LDAGRRGGGRRCNGLTAGRRRGRRGIRPFYRIANSAGVCERHPGDRLVCCGRFVARVGLRFGDGDVLVRANVVDAYPQAITNGIGIVPGASGTRTSVRTRGRRAYDEGYGVRLTVL
jgi:hypothetical protein